MKRVELLAPAGNLERLKIALLYGADAVYFGGRNYGLRANAKNLDLPEIREACDFAHKLGKRVYVTVNIIFHNEDVNGLVEYLHELEKCGVDAIIVSDPLVIDICKKENIKVEIHISTQYSNANKEAIAFFKEMGASRVVLARETSKEEIKEIIEAVPIEIEMFIHGAMCSSYSGRCVLSNYFTNRDANRGGCAQICRWNFDITRDGKKIENDTKFTLASKDLCMLEYLPDIIDIGVSSLKVEGRMRSVYYIATVINNYRRAIDEYYAGTLNKDRIKSYMKELNNVANRDSTPQFFDKFPGVNEQYYLSRDEISNQDFLAIVSEYKDGYVTVISKNYFKTGDMVEFISPDRETFTYQIGELYDEDGNVIEASNRPENKVKFKLDKVVCEFDMMRVKK